jgi:thioredoxin 1
MLETNLPHVETREQFEALIQDNEKVIICCGRMGPMCIPVYEILEVLQERYPDVQMQDMDFDIPVATAIRNLPECRMFNALPFTVYYRGGKVVKATSSIQTATDIKTVMRDVFA